MAGAVMVVAPNGATTRLVEGALRVGVGSALEFGSAVRLEVVAGHLILSGEVPGADPGVAGALWVDGAGFLRVSGG